MRLSTLRCPGGRTTAAYWDGDELVELPYDDVGALLSSSPDWQAFLDGHDGPRVARADAQFETLVPRPDKIICLGLNYASHIAEMGRPTPLYPTLFAKYRASLIGSYDDIHMPAVSDDLDWEAELGVVIGHAGRNLRPSNALQHVAGYTVVNDVTVRDWQHRTREFLSGKTFESTTPVGPALVTTDELPAGAAGLDIGCSVEGRTMQRSNTDDLLFDVADTVAYISTIITLLPGDVIAMGTPGGVGAGQEPPLFLREGQVLRTWVEHIGEVLNTVVKDHSDADWGQPARGRHPLARGI